MDPRVLQATAEEILDFMTAGNTMYVLLSDNGEKGHTYTAAELESLAREFRSVTYDKEKKALVFHEEGPDYTLADLEAFAREFLRDGCLQDKTAEKLIKGPDGLVANKTLILGYSIFRKKAGITRFCLRVVEPAEGPVVVKLIRLTASRDDPTKVTRTVPNEWTEPAPGDSDGK